MLGLSLLAILRILHWRQELELNGSFGHTVRIWFRLVSDLGAVRYTQWTLCISFNSSWMQLSSNQSVCLWVVGSMTSEASVFVDCLDSLFFIFSANLCFTRSPLRFTTLRRSGALMPMPAGWCNTKVYLRDQKALFSAAVDTTQSWSLLLSRPVCPSVWWWPSHE